MRVDSDEPFVRAAPRNPRTGSLASSSTPAQSPRRRMILRARSRFPLARSLSRSGLAIVRCGRSTSALRNTNDSSTRGVVVSRCSVSRVRASQRTRGCSRFQSFRFVPTHPASRPDAFPSPEGARYAQKEARGPFMRARPGESAFHDARLHFGDTSDASRAAFSSARAPLGPPLTSLSPPSRISFENREGRQDRFRGGLVKGERFTGPRCLPS